MSLTVTTGPVRLSWPRLAELTAARPTDKPSVSTAILVPKSDSSTIAAIRSALQEAAAAKWGDKSPRKLRNPIKDGDESSEEYPEQAGHWVINTRSRRLVPVVGRDLLPVDPGDATLVYGGQNARINMKAFAYDVDGSRGVSLGLNMVQILGGGTPFGDAGPVDPGAVFGPALEGPTTGTAPATAGDPAGADSGGWADLLG